jgi:hypothetical protein
MPAIHTQMVLCWKKIIASITMKLMPKLYTPPSNKYLLAKYRNGKTSIYMVVALTPLSWLVKEDILKASG